MREIKFRAYDSVNKKMFFVNEIMFCRNGNHLITEHRGKFEKWTSPLNGNSEVDKWIYLMQFTGLKDKNGKDIYEGDIVKTHDLPYLRKVVEMKGQSWYPWLLDQWEVIGNIYENPELLK